MKKWKPWRFNYSVGAPNAAISAADLQVLYINWKNKLRVSASGYKPEAIRVKGNWLAQLVQGQMEKVFIFQMLELKQARLIVEDAMMVLRLN